MNLDFLVMEIRRLKPGEAIGFTRIMLCSIPHARYNDHLWSPVDQALEKIAGSTYEYTTNCNLITREVTVYRLPTPLSGEEELAYVSPDHRHMFDFDGTYYRRK